MGNHLAEFQNVVKEYPSGLLGRAKLRAVDQVSFGIGAGEAFGLLGPNRAGKTTLVKLLLSLSQPTGGQVLRLGQSSRNRSTLARVGYVHENQAFPRYLTANALLEYYGAMSLLPEPHVKARAAQLLETVGLADRAHEPISRFSKGMVQRLGIAQAMLNDPDLLVMDEPSEGLDLVGRQLVRDLILRQKKAGKAVLFVSHLLPEVELLCDQVGVLAQGKMVFQGPTSQLLSDPQTKKSQSLEMAIQKYYAPPRAA